MTTLLSLHMTVFSSYLSSDACEAVDRFLHERSMSDYKHCTPPVLTDQLKHKVLRPELQCCTSLSPVGGYIEGVLVVELLRAWAMLSLVGVHAVI